MAPAHPPLHRLLAILRERLAEPPAESTRLLHGRGGLLAGLRFVNVDWFAPVVLVVVYDEQPAPWWDALRAGARQLCELPGVASVIAQRRDLPAAPVEVLAGDPPDPLYALSAGLRYELSPGSGRNLGFFLDMIPGHAWLRASADGARVLNLFAYTCAFSVAAVAGGADRVVNLDMSRRALSIGQRNHALNGFVRPRLPADVRYLPHDVFKSWGKLRKLGPYDRIVVDPPSYQFKSFVAARDYPRVIRRLDSLAAPGAQVLLCLNDPMRSADVLLAAVREHAPDLHFVEQLPQAPDHPEADPAAGLKLLVFAREPADRAGRD